MGHVGNTLWPGHGGGYEPCHLLAYMMDLSAPNHDGRRPGHL